MSNHKLFDIQDISRSNYAWNESKTRVNIALSAVLLTGLICTIIYL
jgi:hypothetical protein